MGKLSTALLMAAGVLALTVGCQTPATWVYRDIDYGVVRVPDGSPKNEAAAVRLAREAYPGGVALVRVEQVPVGDLKLESSIKRDAELDGALSSPIDLVAIKGLTAKRERSRDEVETTKLVEVRYIFRNLARDGLGGNGLAYDPDPTASLAMYVDPLRDRRSENAVQVAAKEADPEVKKVSTPAASSPSAPSK